MNCCPQAEPRGGMPMPAIKDIPALLAQYTDEQIAEIPELQYLRDRLK